MLLPAAAGARPPSRLQVVEKEYSLTLSRLRVHAGRVIIQVIDFGMDNHDLVIQRNARGSKPIRFRQLGSGDRITRTIVLAPGRYTMWCSLPRHRALGMVAPLVVTR